MQRAHQSRRGLSKPHTARRTSQTASAANAVSAARPWSATCSRQGFSLGFRKNPRKAARIAGPNQIASASDVQQPATAGTRIQPARRNAKQNAGAKLRRRLSKIFHRDRASSGLAARPSRRRNLRQEPRSDLPIAANPAVAAAHVGEKARGNALKQLHVVDDAAAAKQPRSDHG